MYQARPLQKTDQGDFSQSDPFLEAIRRVMETAFPGGSPATSHGPNVTTMQKGAGAPMPRPSPTRIDLAQLMAQRAAQQPPSPGQPPLPPGWTSESVQAQPVGGPPAPVGSGTPSDMPMPGQRPPMPSPGGMGPGMPQRNPLFSGGIDGGGAQASMGQRPALMDIARAMAGSKQTPPFQQWAQFSPGDLRNSPWTA